LLTIVDGLLIMRLTAALSLAALLMVAAAAPGHAAPMGSETDATGPAPAGAAPPPAATPGAPTSTGLPLPRYQSLGASVVNMRSGPGEQYPIQWVYQREMLPVEVTAEMGPWRKVRDMDGVEGWVNGNLLSDQRTAIVLAQTRLLYASSDSNSRPRFRIEKGVVAKVVVCEEAWCQLSIEGKTGFILRDQIWGTYRGENFN
jgi:SH3-like domain-containing protein